MRDNETRSSLWPRVWRWAAGRPAAVRTWLGRIGQFANVAFVLLLGVAVTAFVTAGLWWGAGGDLAVVPEKTSVLDLLKLGLTVTAGMGGVVALVVAYRKQKVHETAETRLDAAAEREDTKLFNERFGAAAEMLSSSEPARQLAGIYAMAGLSDDWDAGRQTCINVLCGFMRLPYTPPGELSEDASPEEVERYEQCSAHRQVRHALLDVIGDRLRAEPEPGRTWHGHIFDLAGAVIDGGRLNGIRVTDGTRIDFDRAKFIGGRVSFDRAVFSGGEVVFGGAEFSGGKVSFVGAEFAGGEVDFDRAEFSGSEVFFIGAEFSGGVVDFGWAGISGGKVSLGGAGFSGGEVYFDNAEFSGGVVDFDRAGFFGGVVDFDSAEFSGGEVFFSKARFSGGGLYFIRAEFSGGRVYFRRARFEGGDVDFSGVTSWTVPPTFDDFPDGRPEGLMFPDPPPLVTAGSSD